MVIDISNRPHFEYRAEYPSSQIGSLTTELIHEFLWKFALEARVTLHVIVHYGKKIPITWSKRCSKRWAARSMRRQPWTRVCKECLRRRECCKMIAIIDYGMGNLHSVSKAVERRGYSSVITSDEQTILSADGVILPGVGAFGDAMRNLAENGLRGTVQKIADSGTPLLGICLGMQLLFSESEEHGRHEGLNLLPGKVVRFKGDYKVPHIGWNRLEYRQKSLLFQDLEEGHVYFVHSYHVIPDRKEDLLATTGYFQDVTAIVGRDNLFGMQFHPEKSGDVGIKLLGNFLNLCKNKVRQ